MKKGFLIFSFLTIFVAAVSGQENQARKIDEFGAIQCDEYLAHADLMMNSQAERPNSRIYVLVYEGNEKLPVYEKEIMTVRSVSPRFGLAAAVIKSMKAKIKMSKRPLENYVFVNGGFREDFAVEIWLVPPGAEAPTPTPTLKKMKYRKGKAKGFCLSCC